LKVFTDIYQIDVESSVSQILTLLPVLHGLHVKDSEICIPHDVAIGHYGFIYQTERTPEHNYVLLWNNFVQELLESDSNKAGCKRFITGTFIAYPERYVTNALVISMSLISTDSQVLISVKEQNICNDITVQSSIRIHPLFTLDDPPSIKCFGNQVFTLKYHQQKLFPRASHCWNFLIWPTSAGTLGVRYWFYFVFVTCSFGFPPELLDLCVCYWFSLSKNTVLVCKMVELMLLSSSCYGKFDYSSA